jgi:hypothetical protein
VRESEPMQRAAVRHARVGGGVSVRPNCPRPLKRSLGPFGHSDNNTRLNSDTNSDNSDNSDHIAIRNNPFRNEVAILKGKVAGGKKSSKCFHIFQIAWSVTSDSMNVEASQPASVTTFHLFDDCFDPIEAGIRDRARMFVEEMICGELDAVLRRPPVAREAEIALASPPRRGERAGAQRNLAVGGLLPEPFSLVGIARDDVPSEAFRKQLGTKQPDGTLQAPRVNVGRVCVLKVT